MWVYSAYQGLSNIFYDSLYHTKCERHPFTRFSETYETWPNLCVEMAPTGVTESDACISNTRTDKELSLVCLSISPPKLPVVLVGSIFADPLPLRFA